MPLSFFRKIVLTFLFYSPYCFANYVHAIGEFYYGPDTDENTACEYAFVKAKQEAIQTNFGIEIESFVSENCENEKQCSIDIDTYTQLLGTIKQIVSRKNQTYEEYGKKVCRVTINAVIERIDNKTVFELNGKLRYVENEEMDFSISTNTIGYVSVYNFYDSYYHKIHSFQVKNINEEIKVLKNKHKIVAKLPEGKQQNKELLVFVFSEEIPTEKKKLNSFEFSTMISSLNSKTKKLIYRYVTIGKKL